MRKVHNEDEPIGTGLEYRESGFSYAGPCKAQCPEDDCDEPAQAEEQPAVDSSRVRKWNTREKHLARIERRKGGTH